MSEKDNKPKKKESEGPKELTVSLNAWITQKMAFNKKLHPSQRRELEVFLKKQGLTDSEKSERYEEAFTKF